MRLQVVVLYGGKSTEHEVSVHSAQTVVRLLSAQTDKYQVYPVFIDQQPSILYHRNLRIEGYNEETAGKAPVKISISISN